MFYLVTRVYVGPNQDSKHLNSDVIEVWNEPARTNSSKEVLIDGWCGTTNDWSVHAYGEYETLQEALDEMHDIFDVREYQYEGWSSDDSFIDDHVVERYYFGKYCQMDAEGTAIWVYEYMVKDITAETTDDQIEELLLKYEDECKSENVSTHASIVNCLYDYRNELRDRLKYDDDEYEYDDE
jgi:hypothetical protein